MIMSIINNKETGPTVCQWPFSQYIGLQYIFKYEYTNTNIILLWPVFVHDEGRSATLMSLHWKYCDHLSVTYIDLTKGCAPCGSTKHSISSWYLPSDTEQWKLYKSMDTMLPEPTSLSFTSLCQILRIVKSLTRHTYMTNHVLTQTVLSERVFCDFF